MSKEQIDQTQKISQVGECGEDQLPFDMWHGVPDTDRIELLRNIVRGLQAELRHLRHALKVVGINARTARLQVQNHEHSPANGRALFPAAVFEPNRAESTE